MNDRRHTMNIDRSSFTDSPIVNGDRTVGSRSELVELRQLLRQHHAELVRLADTRADRAQVHLEELEEVVAEERPDAARVRHGWDSVLRALKGGAATAESVSKITEAVRSLFGV